MKKKAALKKTATHFPPPKLREEENPCVVSDGEGRLGLVYLPAILLDRENVAISPFPALSELFSVQTRTVFFPLLKFSAPSWKRE